MQLKSLNKQGKRFTVHNVSEKDLARLLVEFGNHEVEWVYSFESPLVKPLMSKQWVEWVFGACNWETGLIHVYLDYVLKAFNITGFEPVEEWFSDVSTRTLVHELIHLLNPRWIETQVEKATEALMANSGAFGKATKLTVYIADRKFEHVLTEDNQVLTVKS